MIGVQGNWRKVGVVELLLLFKRWNGKKYGYGGELEGKLVWKGKICLHILVRTTLLAFGGKVMFRVSQEYLTQTICDSLRKAVGKLHGLTTIFCNSAGFAEESLSSFRIIGQRADNRDRVS